MIFESNGIKISVEDNSEVVLNALKNAVERGLMSCGERAVDYAQNACPKDTGNLANSITYAIDGDNCYIGTNVEYGKYVEFGTGKYAEEGGRQTPWVYEGSDGEWHMTDGMRGTPFLRPSAQNHAEEYRNILKDSLANA